MPNSFIATRPSIFRPTSMIAMSFSMPTILPRTTLPSKASSAPSVSVSMAAKSSRVGLYSLEVVAVVFILSPVQSGRRRGKPAAVWLGALKPILPDTRLRDRLVKTSALVMDFRSIAACGGCFPPIRLGLLVLPRRLLKAKREAQTLLANRPLDQSDGGVECAVYIQVARIEQQGICSHFHRRVGAAGIAGVAAADHIEYALVGDVLAFGA